MKYTFSGHESFQCKSLWLKKGFDFVNTEQSFNDDYAVITLGVGKNMVSSIRFWLKAFGITDEKGQLTTIGSYIFSDQGKDPYVEDESTQWLLHYLLTTTQYATLYNLFFTDFTKTRHEFNRNQLKTYLQRLFSEKRFGSLVYNENTISRDISTLVKNYVKSNATKNFDDFSSVLLDLNLIRQKGDQYILNVVGKQKINPLIFLYTILDQYPNESVIEYQKLLDLAQIFLLTQGELYEIFDELTKYNPNISFSNAAGEQLFAIKQSINKWSVLNDYYQNN